MPQAPSAIPTLQRASAGLKFLSETDAPFAPFFWPDTSGEQLNTQRFEQLASTPEHAPIQTMEIDYFFRNAIKVEEGDSEWEVAEAERYRQLVHTIESTLENVQVFRVGETSIDVYIVGQVEGGHAGLRTLVVET